MLGIARALAVAKRLARRQSNAVAFCGLAYRAPGGRVMAVRYRAATRFLPSPLDRATPDAMMTTLDS